MTDVLIRGVAPDVLAAIDAKAQRVGLSRNEYLRRQLAQDAAIPMQKCTLEDLRRFAETFADLDDPEVMRKAWE